MPSSALVLMALLTPETLDRYSGMHPDRSDGMGARTAGAKPEDRRPAGRRPLHPLPTQHAACRECMRCDGSGHGVSRFRFCRARRSVGVGQERIAPRWKSPCALERFELDGSGALEFAHAGKLARRHWLLESSTRHMVPGTHLDPVFKISRPAPQVKTRALLALSQVRVRHDL